MKLRADLCLVKLAPRRDRSVGGIIEAAADPAATCFGKVVQVGERVPLHGVDVGAFVGFPPSAGESLEGMFVTPHLMVPVSQILFTLEREA